jgi:hypothetical protein
MVSRRRAVLLAVAACLAKPAPLRAQVTDWSEADRLRFAAFRQAFAEYSDLKDAEFARRMESLFRSLDSNPDADVVVAEVSRRLPEYQDVPRRRMQREMISLFRKARQHFEG